MRRNLDRAYPPAHPILITLLRRGYKWNESSYAITGLPIVWRADASRKQAAALRKIYWQSAHPVGTGYTIHARVDEDYYIIDLNDDDSLYFTIFKASDFDIQKKSS